MPTRVTTWLVPAVLCVAFWTAKLGTEGSLAQFSRPTPQVTLESARFYSRSVHKFSLGFDNWIADLTWIQLLQGASHAPMGPGEVSWEYAKIHAINTLDPKFTKAYRFGASFLSIFRRDKIGAEDVLRKWTQIQPNIWQSHYAYGFHLFHEMEKLAPASVEILKAASLPNAPPFLSSLGVRLLSETGGNFAALQSAVEMYETMTDTEGRYRLVRQVRTLNYGLQKAAWIDGVARYRKQYQREPAALGDVEKLPPPPIDYVALVRQIAAPEDVRPLLTETFRFRYDPSTRKVVGLIAPDEGYLEKSGIMRERSP